MYSSTMFLHHVGFVRISSQNLNVKNLAKVQLVAQAVHSEIVLNLKRFCADFTTYLFITMVKFTVPLQRLFAILMVLYAWCIMPRLQSQKISSYRVHWKSFWFEWWSFLWLILYLGFMNEIALLQASCSNLPFSVWPLKYDSHTYPPSRHNAGMFVECIQSLTLLPGPFVTLPTLQPLPSQIGTIRRARKARKIKKEVKKK